MNPAPVLLLEPGSPGCEVTKGCCGADRQLARRPQDAVCVDTILTVNPDRGFGLPCCVSSETRRPGPFNLVRRGEFATWRQARPGPIQPGVQGKSLTAKSSTMKGPKGLAGEYARRRCRTAKHPHRGIRGSFWFLPPEIAGTPDQEALVSLWKLCRDGSPGHTVGGPKVNPF